MKKQQLCKKTQHLALMPKECSSSTSIIEALLSESFINKDQLEIAKIEQRQTKKPLEKILVDLGFLTDKALSSLAASHSGIEKFDLAKTVIDPTILRLLPKEIAFKHKMLPVSLEENNLYLAMADIYDVLALDQARRSLGSDWTIQPMAATEQDIFEALNQYDQEILDVGTLFRLMESTKKSEDNPEQSTIQLVNSLIFNAVKQGASDLHFQPEGQFVRLRYRMDGVLSLITVFHKDYWPSVCVRMKLMAGLNIAESRKPQSGRFSLQVDAHDIDFRASTHPTVHGENLVLRILAKSKALLPLESLGFSERTIEILKEIISSPQGVFLVTGPTGSGKTTTLYSILQYLNSSEINIMSLEDPVEYQLPMIRQSAINEMAGTTFAEGIRSLLRQDPDIIYVGEVRDEDTATMSLRAAMTGHQVFTTLHTNDTFGVIHRLSDLGIPPSMLMGHINGVLAQRLVRLLCPHCKTPQSLKEDESLFWVDHTEVPSQVYEATGCRACRHTGYKGRMAVSELLRFTEALEEAVLEGKPLKDLKETARGEGFLTLQEDALEKVSQGMTSLSEIKRCIGLSKQRD